MTKFWSIKAASEETAELILYGDIGDDGWADNGCKAFAEELRNLGNVTNINVRINSPGGGVFAGQAIYSSLKNHKAHVTVHIDGLAASIASVIAMAGDTIIMPRNAMMMIHNPWTIAMGDSADFRKTADDLDQIRETIVAAYQDKTGMPHDGIVELMDDETWLTAQDALDYGFIDQMDAAQDMAASLSTDGRLTINGSAKLDPGKFKHFPETLTARAKPAAEEGDKNMELTKEILAAEHAELMAAIQAEARIEGIEAGKAEERARIKAIEELDPPGCEGLIQNAKFRETPMTAAEVAMEIIKAQKVQRDAKLVNLEKDAAKLGEIQPGATDLDSGESEAKEREAKANAIAKGINATRK
jgi:ATP-dependent Clp endopeptidase proteolytic subunit ClpP